MTNTDAHSKQPGISWYLHSLYFVVILKNLKCGFLTATWLSLWGNRMLYGKSHIPNLTRNSFSLSVLSYIPPLKREHHLSFRIIALSSLRVSPVTKSYSFYLLNYSSTLLSILKLNALTHNILHYSCLLIGLSSNLSSTVLPEEFF